ncbi:MAG: selenocysteine-specific translation elongation factor [Alphaproteobacteria bacterium]|nr:selenocysteine-specific translation elongation factor [Alphaproteobacteria bacterium]
MIVATAGHVDHGKTTLVRAITGIDTDRLPEEKKRGLTIDLGFAYMDVDDDVLGFVDVPGHERFVKNMLAGVATIDFALLVIAADDGVMPQTVEHLAILQLLGIRQGAVAISKIDRADADRLAALRAAIGALRAPTELAAAPMFPVSGETGEGVAELQAHLQETARQWAERPAGGNFRLAVDRSFTVPGAGLVATGAVFSGQVAVGDRLLLSPRGIEVRVRGIHALDRVSDSGRAGQRCALNIAGAELRNISLHRGEWLLAEGAHAPVRKLDARLRVLASEQRPLAHWTPVHLHLAATDVTARVAVLEDRRIAPGETGLAQIVLDAPIGALFGDRFILRDQSARRTIAGGTVIDPFPPARGRTRAERLEMLRAMEETEPRAALRAMLRHAPAGINLRRFALARNLTEAQATPLDDGDGQIVLSSAEGGIALPDDRWLALRQDVLAALRAWHERRPEAVGPNDHGLRGALAAAPPAELFAAAVGKLLAAGDIVRDGISLRLPDHQARADPADLALWEAIEPILADGGLRPPRVRELAEQLDKDPKTMEAFLKRCTRQGRLLAVAPNRFFPPAAVRELAAVVEEMVAESPEGTFNASAFKDRTGIGRNLAIEVLEFFDGAGLTRREGNERHLRRPADEVFGDT